MDLSWQKPEKGLASLDILLQDLEKKSTKHPSLDKQRDTPTYLNRYHCKGTVNIEILSSLDYINSQNITPTSNTC